MLLAEDICSPAMLPCCVDDEENRYNYQTEVAFVDQQIQRLLDALPKEDTYILFISDHGESLGDHEYWGHLMQMYQANTMQFIQIFLLHFG